MSVVSTGKTSSPKKPASLHQPPGPWTLNPLGSIIPFQRYPLRFIDELRERYGDIVRFRLFNMPMILINHPEYLKRVLLDNYANYDKDVFLFHLLRPILGNGLATMIGGQEWLLERRLMQPAFHRQRIVAFGTFMTQATLERLQSWEALAAEGRTFNVAEEMAQLSLRIVSQTLFSVDISDKSNLFGQAFLVTNQVLAAYARFPFPPLTFPTPSHRRLWRAVRTMNETATSIIDHRRQGKGAHDDLLSLLLEAVDEETGTSMNSQQLLDEVKTILVAGHETSANTLSWIWYVLAQHPDIERKLHAELDQVLAGRLPTVGDLPHLPYTRMVIDETLRFYAIVWQIMRQSREADTLGEYAIPAKTIIFFSTYLLHRHPDFWEKPTEFYPEHFLPEQVAKRPRYAYLPFSSGPRQCIGNTFALTEIQLVLATIAQRYRLVLDPGATIEVDPSLALRPRYGVPVKLEPRKTRINESQ